MSLFHYDVVTIELLLNNSISGLSYRDSTSNTHVLSHLQNDQLHYMSIFLDENTITQRIMALSATFNNILGIS